tara:strand:- start:155 stop:1276 length:1122 start_codon:yes stop_codon:yes gene_type:complete
LHAFYIFGISDLQDLLPVILTSIKRGNQVWVCFLDCLTKKRQFYYYTPEELFSFISGVCSANDLKIPTIGIYGLNDQSKFESDYSQMNPEYVFLQNATHKNISWYPIADKSKVIHFAWHMDSARTLMDTHYNVILNSVKFRKDLSYYGKPSILCIPDWVRVLEGKKKALESIDSQFFGNLRTEALEFKGLSSIDISAFSDKKVCFIIEAHLRKNDYEFSGSTVDLVHHMLRVLKEEGFYTIWKKREKGYPKGDWYSPLDVCDAKPDLVIEKDLNFPNTISYFSSLADTTIVINTSTAVFDAIDVSDKVIMVHPEFISDVEKRKFKNRYENQGNFEYVHSDWAKFRRLVKLPKSPTPRKQICASGLLLDYLKRL